MYIIGWVVDHGIFTHHNLRGESELMTYIIAEPCIDVLDRACIDVCPVDCIYEAEEHKMLLINPEECIDCAACEPVCPVAAIFAEDDVPADWDKYTDLNYEYFGQER